MTANNRLWLIAGLIVFSAGYALLVKKDPELADNVWRIYIAIMLTTLVVLNVWKKP